MSGESLYRGERFDDCGCCEGVTAQTPARVENRPGLSAIAYRIGTHPSFKQSLLAALSSSEVPGLTELRTREDDDFSIALMDAWATVGDILTFYQERIANESYLRTATERLSLLELARLIGYQLGSGVAATTQLAFTLEEAPGAPDQATQRTTIPEGTAVRSTPGPGETAQMFETIEEIEGRIAWNAIRPRLTKRQELGGLSAPPKTLYFEGIATNLRPGDGVLFRYGGSDSAATAPNALSTAAFGVVDEVEMVPQEGVVGNHTKVTLKYVGGATPAVPLREPSPGGVSWFASASIQEDLPEFTTSPASEYQGPNPPSPPDTPPRWEADDLAAEAEIEEFEVEELLDTLTNNPRPALRVLVFRARAGVFGHNAPPWKALPQALRDTSKDPLAPFASRDTTWNDKTLALFNTSTLDPNSIVGPEDVFLDNVYSGIAADSYVVARDGSTWAVYEVKQVADVSKAEFNVAAKVTRLTLDVSTHFSSFGIQTTTFYAESEVLELAREPVTDAFPESDSVPWGDGSPWIELDGWVDGLETGQRVAVTGEVIAGTGDDVSELAVVDEVEHDLDWEGRTRIKLKASLENAYVRKTVTLNANVAEATHGETVKEALGAGDARQTYQRFSLTGAPLTHVSADTDDGSESTLEVRVNDVLWKEVDYLLGKGSEDRVFISRTDDDGKTWVQFGDGVTGTRLPTGQDNVRAEYRKGIGLGGLVGARQLTNLMSRPLGVKEVVNPLAAEGAEDPETRGLARQNAPLSVLTLDRVVSLLDYQDYSRAFKGVAKSLATWTWDGRLRGVFITLAGPKGAAIPAGGTVAKKLSASLLKWGDPHVRVTLASYRKALFRVEGTVYVHPDHLPDKVGTAVKAALRKEFAFDRRDFGQPVAASEVIALIQRVTGVVAVDLDKLYRSDGTAAWNARLLAELPGTGENGDVLAAELLTLDPAPLDGLTVKI